MEERQILQLMAYAQQLQNNSKWLLDRAEAVNRKHVNIRPIEDNPFCGLKESVASSRKTIENIENILERIKGW